jgi:L-seryl-tRNA(Ser) seleniumtransferase
MKVGREEVVGMVVAVESYVRRDHDAEWKQWVARCEHIAARVSKIPGVTAIVQKEPGGRSNRSPRLSIRWESAKLGITGADVSELLDTSEPRIALGGGGGGRNRGEQEQVGDTGISIGAAMMQPGDEKIVADRVYQILSAKHTLKPVEPPKPPAATLSGRWEVEIQYAAGSATHMLLLLQDGNKLEGTHQGNFLTREITGTIDGDAVSLASTVTERNGDSLNYRFTGTASADAMSGTLSLGEYLGAKWTARRYASGRPSVSA